MNFLNKINYYPGMPFKCSWKIPDPFIFPLDSPKDHPKPFDFLISISALISYPLGAGVFIFPLVKSDFFP